MDELLPEDVMYGGLVMAAGSLRAAMDDLVSAYRQNSGTSFETMYGPSGNLRKQIEAGASTDVFASASLDHLDALASAALLGQPVVFARNVLCLVARPELHIDTDRLVDALCNPAVRVATSTPGSDPMGDYTWRLFANIDRQKPGAFRLLKEKALKLSGARIPDPAERSPYLTAFEEDRADVYVMYRTNALMVQQRLPQLQAIRIPDAYNVQCDYGIASSAHSSNGRLFVDFVLSESGRRMLERHGFEMP